MCDQKIGPYSCCSIVQGDCLDLMADLPTGSVDFVVTDPPYFLPAVHYNTRTPQVRNLGELGILEGFYKRFVSEEARILKDGGVVYCFCDGQSYPVFYSCGYSFFKAQRPLLWDKQTSINGYTWRHQHEIILFAEKLNAPKIPTGDGDVFKMRAVKIGERLHPAEKPVELLSLLIKKHSAPYVLANRGTPIIFDPFAGSGATAEAAAKLGCHYLGFELSLDYCEIARKRLRENTDVKAV